MQRAEEKQFQEKLKNIKYYYEEHNIDKAYELVKQLKNLREVGSNVDHKKLFEKVERQYNDMKEFSNPIKEIEWELKDKQKEVKIFTKYINDEMNVLIESKVDLPGETVLQTLVELNLLSEIIPLVGYSKQEKIIERNMKIGNFIVDIPIIASRQAFFQGIVYDRLQTNGTIFIFIRSINNDTKILQSLDYRPTFHAKTQPLDFKSISFQYTPFSPTSGVCKLCLSINLALGIIPKFIIQKIVKSFSFKIYKNIIKASTNFKNSQWQKSLKTNSSLYNFLKQKLTKHFSSI